MMISVTDLGDFEAHVRHHFFVDGLSDSDIQELHTQWRAMLANGSVMGELADALMQINRIGEGQSWWEEYDGDPGADRPPTDLNWASVMLKVSDARHRIRARPYCPPSLCGRWTLLAVSLDDRTETTPSTARNWVLAPDGGLDTGDPEHAGWTWRVHRGRYDKLWFGPERRPTTQQRLILRLDGDRAKLATPSGWRGHEIWQVTS